MSRKRKGIYTAVLSVVCLAFLALFIITANRPDTSVQFYNDIPAYQRMFTPTDNPLYIAYETQAIPLMKAGVAKAYRTDFVGTVIIAVDRDRVKDEITGWNSLRTGDYDVYFNYKGKLSHIDFGYTILSMAAGLDSDNGGYNNTIQLLKRLHNRGRLISDDPSGAPVAIMFDYNASQRVKDGQNIEIIVPEEGTLSFPVGIMSTYTAQLPDVTRADMLTAGFRLPNGECDPLIYPNAGHYASAHNAALTSQSSLQSVSAVAAFQRQVLRKRLLSAANGVENMLSYIVFIIIIVLWSGLLYMRISDKAMQNKLFAISVLLLFWMLVRVIRLQLPDGMVDRFFWYLYYIPLIFLPTVLFWIGQVLTRRGQNRFHRLTRKSVFLISILLVLLVLTNDFHQEAFRFYRGMEGNTYDQYYSRGWVYYLVFAWSFLLILLFVFTAARDKIGSAAKRAGPLLLTLCISIIYFGGYALGIPVFVESEFSIVYGVIALLFLEICFRSRIIPNNILLGQLLHNAPIDMYILSDAMQIEYRTDYSEELSGEVVEQVRHLQPEKNLPLGISLPNNESILYGVHRINGGYSIFAQHLDTVIRLRKALAEQNKKIKIQNSILARTNKVKREIARLQTQQELFARIEGVLKDRVNRINAILPVLPVDITKEKIGKLQKQLAKIKVLVNYCKRRGNLALLEAGDEYCDTDSLALWLQEAIWEANAAGIDGLVTEAGNTQIHSTQASQLYDCFEHILENAMKYVNAVLLVNLSVAENSVVLRISIETAPAIEPSHFQFKQVLYDALDSMGANYGASEHDDGLTIQITVPRGGRNNG
jgi:hypothetical protein